MTAFLLLALFATGCSDQFQEVNQAPAPQAKLVSNSTEHFSLISGNAQSMYSAEVIEYTDGSVEVRRSVVPFDPNKNYVHSVLNSNVPIAHSSQGTQVDFGSGDGWFVPFDPGEPALRVSGRVIQVNCECDNGATGCNVDIEYDPSTGKADVGCMANQDCTGNCRAHLTFSNTNMTQDGDILISAAEVIVP